MTATGTAGRRDPGRAQRWRAKSTRMRVALAVYGVPTRGPSRGSSPVRGSFGTVHIARAIPRVGPPRLSSRAWRGEAIGVSQILICTVLMAALLGGRPAGMAALTGLVVDRADRAVSHGTVSHGTVSHGTVSHDGGADDTGTEPAPRFGWPLPGSPTVVRAFHPPAFRYGPGHRGVDLATVSGAPVFAADAGTVAFAGTVAGYGVVSVDHPGGLRTTYEPVSPIVTIGDRVARGERIGTVQPGHPGCPVAVCLHWGVLRVPNQSNQQQDREYLDPLRLLAPARVRLLPIDGPL
jgi:murein DD-endopeptidase MepM/ murein hydrolase activator NlpD